MGNKTIRTIATAFQNATRFTPLVVMIEDMVSQPLTPRVKSVMASI
jgi:hypothetical protein